MFTVSDKKFASFQEAYDYAHEHPDLNLEILDSFGEQVNASDVFILADGTTRHISEFNRFNALLF